MKRVIFHFDVISPYAYLAFERLPQALEGLSVEVEYRPLLFAGLLQHWGTKGPAETAPKKVWTFRHVAWLAHEFGIADRDAGAAPVQSARAAAPGARLRACRRHAQPAQLRVAVPARVAAAGTMPTIRRDSRRCASRCACSAIRRATR